MVVEEQQRYLYYGLLLTCSRLAEVYETSPDHMRRILCRADFAKFEDGVTRSPRRYRWGKEFESRLDNYMERKGYKRCIASRVPSRYS